LLLWCCGVVGGDVGGAGGEVVYPHTQTHTRI